MGFYIRKYPGRQIGQYIIEQPIGEGRYGQCFIAHALDGSCRVVLKRYKPYMLRKNKEKNHYEAILLSQIDHDSIPELLGVINSRSFYALVLEYMPGVSVEQLLYRDNRRFDDREIYNIGSKLINIIKYLHQKGIVHCDIRASNVLINNDEVYLVDFGLARWSDSGKYYFDLDYSYLGDFLLHLLYSSYIQGSKNKKQPWYNELCLPSDKELFIKRLLKLGKPHSGIDELEWEFIRSFGMQNQP